MLPLIQEEAEPRRSRSPRPPLTSCYDPGSCQTMDQYTSLQSRTKPYWPAHTPAQVETPLVTLLGGQEGSLRALS